MLEAKEWSHLTCKQVGLLSGVVLFSTTSVFWIAPLTPRSALYFKTVHHCTFVKRENDKQERRTFYDWCLTKGIISSRLVFGIVFIKVETLESPKDYLALTQLRKSSGTPSLKTAALTGAVIMIEKCWIERLGGRINRECPLLNYFAIGLHFCKHRECY